MAHRETKLVIHRDALTTPWGIRIQGGKDFKTPVSVQRVLSGSPCDGELFRGDVILSLQHFDSSGLLHKEAQDLIRSAGGTLTLTVGRVVNNPRAGGGAPAGIPHHAKYPGFPGAQSGGDGTKTFRTRGFDTISPKAHPGAGPMNCNQNYGMDYSRGARQPIPSDSMQANYDVTTSYQYQPAPPFPQSNQHDQGVAGSGMLNRINNSLSNQSAYGSSFGADAQQGVKIVKPNVPTNWKPPPAAGLSDPGWAPRGMSAAGPVAWNQTHSHQRAGRPVAPYRPQLAAYVPPHIEDTAGPAWAGTLRGSSAPKQWEVKAASQQAGCYDEAPRTNTPSSYAEPSYAGATVQPHQPHVQKIHYGRDGPTFREPEGAKVLEDAHAQHLQYNSPLGMYSKGAVVEALEGQTKGKPGYGTLQVTGGGGERKVDLNSDLCRMIAAEDARSVPRVTPTHRAQTSNPFPGHVQSHTFNMLERQYANGGGGAGAQSQMDPSFQQQQEYQQQQQQQQQQHQQQQQQQTAEQQYVPPMMPEAAHMQAAPPPPPGQTMQSEASLKLSPPPEASLDGTSDF